MQITKLDGWKNLLTGLGFSGRDKNKDTYAYWQKPEENSLEELYAASDVARTIVDEIPYEGTREWIDFSHENPEVSTAWKSLFESWQVREKFREAWSLARLHGGSGILMVTDADPQEIQEPLDVERIGSEGGLKNLLVFNRWEMQRQSTTSDPTSSNYGLPGSYLITPRFSEGAGLGSLRVHHSRILRFDGMHLPRKLFVQNNYWGDSVLTGTAEAITAYSASFNYATNALADFSVSVIKMKNLAEMFMAGKESVITNRLMSMNMCKSTLRTIVLDEEEDFQNVTRSLTGIGEALGKAEDRLVVASKMPRTRILGDSSKGLGNEGKSDDRKWYDFVSNQQEAVLSKKIDLLIEAFKASNGIIQSDDISWDFAQLWQMSDAEKAEIYSKYAAGDASYIDRGVLSASDAAKRFEGEHFLIDLKIDEYEEDDSSDEQILAEMAKKENQIKAGE
jgi:hypothetical protein